MTGSDREALRRIINAFRTEGVSFLTPYPPEEIKDATVIDISHEALIRCWRRIADPKDGWLQREFQDGLIWRSLLAPADSFFQTDYISGDYHMLSEQKLVFVSYSHKDQKWLDQLLVHLKPLERAGKIIPWADTRFMPEKPGARR